MVAFDLSQESNKCHYTMEGKILSCTELETANSDISHLIKRETFVIFIRNSPHLTLKRKQYSHPSFSGVQSLQILDSENVKIQPGAFVGFKNMTYLKLIRIGLEEIFDDNFEGLEYLEDMILSNNKIRKLNPKSFSHLDRLTSLDLSSNDLQTLPAYTFETLDNLERLDLTMNHINQIQRNALNGLENLKELSLTNNSLEEFSADEFNRLINLEICLVDSNNIKLIRGAINLPKLKFFDLKDNRLTHIDSNTFEKCSELQSLDLSNNKLNDITERPFIGLKNLRHLNLYNNFIDMSKFTLVSKQINIVHN
nr:unnamed protein product [Callosobruchus chinensis]